MTDFTGLASSMEGTIVQRCDRDKTVCVAATRPCLTPDMLVHRHIIEHMGGVAVHHMLAMLLRFACNIFH